MARIGELIGPNGEVMHPKTSASVVYLEDGRSVEQVLSDDIDYGNVVFQDNSYKFDSDVEDDFAKTVVIKGQTYQNILPEPSTHVLSNNKKMFKVNEGLDPMVEVVDGVSKSAILSGNTLVNLTTSNDYTLNKHSNIVSGTTISVDVKTPKEIKYTVLEEYTDWVYFHITINLSMLKPNRKYIVMTDMAENINYARICRGDGQDALDQSYGYFNGGKIATLTTNDLSNNTSTGIKLYLRVKTGLSVGDVVHVKNVRLIEYQEGMENWSISHFEGMVSCEMPVLQTIGKNLFSLDSVLEWHKLYWTVNSSEVGTTKPLQSANGLKSFTIKNIKNHTLTFSKAMTNAFRVFGTYSKPAVGVSATALAINNTGTSLTFDSKNYEYLVVVYYSYNDAPNIGEEEAKNTIQLEVGSIATSYEPYKTNILHAPEEVVLKGINGVKDTLNCNAGEYVQRIKEVVLNGSENWIKQSNGTLWRFVCEDVLNHSDYNEICDKLPTGKSYWAIDETGLYIGGNHKPVIVFNSGDDRYNYSLTQFKEWLSQNPVTVQYKLEVPTIKTVDVSTSGNWEKVVLDGSEDEVWHNGDPSWANKIFRLDGARHTPNIMNSANALVKTGLLFSSHFEEKEMNNLCNLKPQPEGVSIYGDSIFVGSPQISTIGELRTWLSQNPITVWYQTQTHLDSTQVKQAIFFKDGHIQLSSGADHSLIPTLDYQAKTSNSYVMDLMKTNTRYTMKAKSASGTFTIDGTSYGAGTNGIFTTPSSMTNKFLVMSNKTNEEVMILEGDAVSKAIPYFKGIKSAFEDEGKIEVLSQGKNLFDVNEVQTNDRTRGAWETRIEGNKIYSMRVTSQVSGGEFGAFIQIPVKPSVEYVYKFDFTSTDPNLEDPQVYIYNNSSIWGELLSSNGSKTTKFTTKANTQFITIGLNYRSGVQKGTEFCTYNAILIETTQTRDYEPYKSNSTKIPLLSPLRSLPNGVCDELIIDRMKKKATLIQRVEAIPVTSVDDIRLQANLGRYNRFFIHKRQTTHPTFSVSSTGSQLSNWCPHHAGFTTDSYHFYVDGAGDIMLFDKSETLNSIRTKMSQSPFVALHQLATPIVTEIDLEGFPYIYKDGHIFLNSEIAPTVGVEYSLNQGQRIAGQVETLQRHEKQFSKLEQYFADLVYSDYNFALLRLNEELH